MILLFFLIHTIKGQLFNSSQQLTQDFFCRVKNTQPCQTSILIQKNITCQPSNITKTFFQPSQSTYDLDLTVQEEEQINSNTYSQVIVVLRLIPFEINSPCLLPFGISFTVSKEEPIYKRNQFSAILFGYNQVENTVLSIFSLDLIQFSRFQDVAILGINLQHYLNYQSNITIIQSKFGFNVQSLKQGVFYIQDFHIQGPITSLYDGFFFSTLLTLQLNDFSKIMIVYGNVSSISTQVDNKQGLNLFLFKSLQLITSIDIYLMNCNFSNTKIFALPFLNCDGYETCNLNFQNLLFENVLIVNTGIIQQVLSTISYNISLDSISFHQLQLDNGFVFSLNNISEFKTKSLLINQTSGVTNQYLINAPFYDMDGLQISTYNSSQGLIKINQDYLVNQSVSVFKSLQFIDFQPPQFSMITLNNTNLALLVSVNISGLEIDNFISGQWNNFVFLVAYGLQSLNIQNIVLHRQDQYTELLRLILIDLIDISNFQFILEQQSELPSKVNVMSIIYPKKSLSLTNITLENLVFLDCSPIIINIYEDTYNYVYLNQTFDFQTIQFEKITLIQTRQDAICTALAIMSAVNISTNIVNSSYTYLQKYNQFTKEPEYIVSDILYFQAKYGSLIMTNVSFLNNQGSAYSTMTYVISLSMYLDDCQFINNSQPLGHSSGLYIRSTIVNIVNTQFLNSTQYTMSLLWFHIVDLVSNAILILDNCVFQNISSTGQAAKVFFVSIKQGSTIITNGELAFLTKIINCKVYNSTSFNSSGFLTILKNFMCKIYLINIQFVDCFSLRAGIILYQEFSYQVQLTVQDCLITHSSSQAFSAFVQKLFQLNFGISIPSDKALFHIESPEVAFKNITIQNMTGMGFIVTNNGFKIDLDIISLTNCFSQETIGFIYIKNVFQFKISNSILQNLQSLSLGSKGLVYLGIVSQIIIINSSFTNLDASWTSGAVFNFFRTLVQINVSNSTFSKLKGYVSGAVMFVNIVQLIYNKDSYLLYGGTSKGAKITISDSTFDQNEALGQQATKGGAIYSRYHNLTIINSRFSQCSAMRGGAIYFSSNKHVKYTSITINTSFIANRAQIGGALRGIICDFQLQNVSFKMNEAQIYGKDFIGYPRQFGFLFGNQTVFPNSSKFNFLYPLDLISGEMAPKLELFFVDKQSRIKIIENIYVSNSFTHLIIKNTKKDNTSNILGQTTSYWNPKSKSYVFENLTIFHDPYSKQTMKIAIFNNMVRVPIYDSKSLSYKYKQSQITIELRTQKCIDGQQLLRTTGVCLTCQTGEYNLAARQVCKRCHKPYMQSCPGGNIIMVSPGYWRLTNKTDLIAQCVNKYDNCLGGNLNFTCKEYMIGALCEECDIYGEIWVRNSNKQPYVCYPCTDLNTKVMRVILSMLFTMMLMTFSVSSACKTITNKVITQICIKLGFIGRRDPILLNKIGILLKMLTHYIQIIGSLSQFDVEFPTGLLEAMNIVGNSMSTINNSLDCQYADIGGTVISIIYLRMIFALVIPISFILVYLIAYCLVSWIQGNYTNLRAVISTSFLYMFMYAQPSIIQGLIDLASFREINDIYYIKANISYHYFTPTHIKYLTVFILPALVTVFILIPALMFRYLYNHKNALERIRVKLSLGYLYSEYRAQAYFWEFMKIFEKVSIICILSFYHDQYLVKGIFSYLIIFSYGLVSQKVNPFSEIFLNHLDNTQTNMCAISILVGIFLYKNEFFYLKSIGYVVLIGLNVNYLWEMVVAFILNILIKHNQKLHQLKLKLQNLFPTLFKILNIRLISQEKIQQSWKSARDHFGTNKEKRQSTLRQWNFIGDSQIDQLSLSARFLSSREVIQSTAIKNQDSYQMKKSSQLVRNTVRPSGVQKFLKSDKHIYKSIQIDQVNVESEGTQLSRGREKSVDAEMFYKIPQPKIIDPEIEYSAGSFQ